MLAQRYATGTAMTAIQIDHLNYGKLTVGENRRVPSSEGYGVTRRSKGLSQTPEGNFLPASLLEIKKFDRDMIDEAARKQGCFFVRTVRNGSNKVVILRSRFRPEDGEDGSGRMYQQTAVWVVRPNDWADNPAGILAEASRSLRARPDLVDEPSRDRIDIDPLTPSIAPSSGIRAPLSIGAKMILNMLLPSALQGDDGDTSEDRGIFFGKGDFADEATFLAAVGEALAELGPTFGRWDEISCASGVRCECRGLFIRYLPSDVPHGLVEISERSIRDRLARLGSQRGRARLSGDTFPSPSTKEINFGKPKNPGSFVVTKIGEPKPSLQSAPADLAPAAVPGHGLASAQLQRRQASLRDEPGAPARRDANAGSPGATSVQITDFHATLDDYRKRPSAHTADLLLGATTAVLQSIGSCAIWFNASTQPLASNELNILQNVQLLLRQDLKSIALGGLMDLALLFDRAEQPRNFRQHAEPIFAELHYRVSTMKVLLPQELDLLAESNLFRPERRILALSTVVNDSELLRRWLSGVRAKGNRPANPDRHIASMLRILGERLSDIFTEPFHLADSETWATGIHGRYLLTPQAILGPAQYGSAARLMMFVFVSQYILTL